MSEERARKVLAAIVGNAVQDLNADGYYHVDQVVRAMLAFAKEAARGDEHEGER